MSTYTQILYQIVFSTKNRDKILIKENREILFRYIWGILKNKKCLLYQINGVDDHIHIVLHLHQSVSLSDLIKEIKTASSKYIKENKLFPNFDSWQVGYGAFTYSIKEKQRLIDYVKNQEEHHRKKDFREEFKDLLKEHEIDFNEKYFL